MVIYVKFLNFRKYVYGTLIHHPAQHLPLIFSRLRFLFTIKKTFVYCIFYFTPYEGLHKTEDFFPCYTFPYSYYPDQFFYQFAKLSIFHAPYLF